MSLRFIVDFAHGSSSGRCLVDAKMGFNEHTGHEFSRWEARNINKTKAQLLNNLRRHIPSGRGEQACQGLEID